MAQGGSGQSLSKDLSVLYPLSSLMMLFGIRQKRPILDIPYTQKDLLNGPTKVGYGPQDPEQHTQADL